MLPDKNALCGYCNMPSSMHCPGGILHVSDSKAQRHLTRCVSRHCLAPMCDCINFVEKNDAEKSRPPTQREGSSRLRTR